MRRVLSTLHADEIIDDGDMRLLRVLPQADQVSVGPFVFLDHYRHQSLRGIGDQPHPHAGIEVVSYLLEGSVEHRDSMGFRDVLGPGDAQLIRSGRGMLHAEQPLAGRHGLQFWLALPPDLMEVEPTYASFNAAEVPKIVTTSGTTAAVVAGNVGDITGPLRLSGNGLVVHLKLDRGAQFSAEVRSDLELGLYVLGGRANVGAALVNSGDLAVLTAGEGVKMSASEDGPLEAILIGGSALEHDVVFSGPFVAQTRAQLERAKRAFASGHMGRLEGIPF